MLCNADCLPSGESQRWTLDCRAVKVIEANFGFHPGSSYFLKLPMLERAFGERSKSFHEASCSPSDLQLWMSCLLSEERGAKGTSVSLYSYQPSVFSPITI